MYIFIILESVQEFVYSSFYLFIYIFIYSSVYLMIHSYSYLFTYKLEKKTDPQTLAVHTSLRHNVTPDFHSKHSLSKICMYTHTHTYTDFY